jgi:hypothetical protein
MVAPLAAAFRAAAQSDGRSVSNLMRMIIRDWLADRPHHGIDSVQYCSRSSLIHWFPPNTFAALAGNY